MAQLSSSSTISPAAPAPPARDGCNPYPAAPLPPALLPVPVTPTMLAPDRTELTEYPPFP
jgi:hypothetical protein